MKTARIFLLLFFAFFISCKNNTSEVDIPQIKNPTYRMYQVSDEGGYLVSFQASSEFHKPYAVVINGIKKVITPAEQNGDLYNVRVISQIRRLHNYSVNVTKEENGIIFRNASGRVHVPVQFVLEP